MSETLVLKLDQRNAFSASSCSMNFYKSFFFSGNIWGDENVLNEIMVVFAEPCKHDKKVTDWVYRRNIIYNIY